MERVTRIFLLVLILALLSLNIIHAMEPQFDNVPQPLKKNNITPSSEDGERPKVAGTRFKTWESPGMLSATGTP